MKHQVPEGLDRVRQLQCSAGDAFCAVSLARLKMAQGKTQEAKALLARLASATEEGGRLIELLLLHAVWHQQSYPRQASQLHRLPPHPLS